MGVLNSFDSIYRFLYETLSDIKAVFVVVVIVVVFGGDGEGGGKEEGWWW